MSYLQQQMEILKFDKRMLEINLKTGAITQAQYDQHIQNLKDDVENSETVNLERESQAPSDSLNGQPQGGTNPEGTPFSAPTNTDPFGSGY